MEEFVLQESCIGIRRSVTLAAFGRPVRRARGALRRGSSGCVSTSNSALMPRWVKARIPSRSADSGTPCVADTEVMNTKPLLLLDVDGVINDLEAVMMLRFLGEGGSDRAERSESRSSACKAIGWRSPITCPNSWVSSPRDPSRGGARRGGSGPTTNWPHTSGWGRSRRSTTAAPPLAPHGRRPPHRRSSTLQSSTVAPVVWIANFCGRLPDLAGVTYVDNGEGVLRCPTCRSRWSNHDR